MCSYLLLQVKLFQIIVFALIRSHMKPHLGAFPLKILGLKEQPNADIYFYGPSKYSVQFSEINL